jgi:NADH dehydrogenase
MMKVLVLGGNGFIGRNAVNALQKYNLEVIVGTRKDKTNQSNVVTIKLQEMLEVADWLPLLSDIDVVVNAVGILRERTNESYEAVHYLAPKALASACAQLGVRMIHISALGLSEGAKSRFIRSKFKGEQAILSSSAQAVIVRPSLLDGEGGYGAKWFRRLAKWPIHFVMRSEGLIAPLQVGDLGEAVANLCQMPVAELPTIVELGGGKVISIAQYLTLLRVSLGKKPSLQITVPKLQVRLMSHIFDVMAWTPLSFGHYELMQGYNVPELDLLPKILGRQPRALGFNNTLEGNPINEVEAIKPIQTSFSKL